MFFLDDHNFSGGMSDLLISFLTENHLTDKKILKKFGFTNFPACGTYEEVLKFHKLDHVSLSNQIIKKLKR